ncbi:BT0820 family HAD-type phosphatase [Gilvibacter sediminis]|uniref:BT0820 family HAD-type phosphatase n=1 Tax=Gilvibacter sediminis TaxID=379071 RepID=UPI0023506569|nr:hydrolase [Gilvibacter sediminis]MDC7998571.1 hydrolase [Gilvibacter sediminis]
MEETRKIAVDFDGTIVENAYPRIGKPMLFAFDTMKKLQQKGFRLILWTYRHGKSLEEAVEFCKANGVEFYAVNQSFPEEEFTQDVSRKINADLFIDDRNIGGMWDWGLIYQELIGEQAPTPRKKKSLFAFLKK